jgi:hypothetical protein
MSFLRHGKIYRSDGLRGKLNWLSNFPRDHRFDMLQSSLSQSTQARPVALDVDYGCGNPNINHRLIG